MRQYRFQATDETVEALRVLRGAWAGFRVEPSSFTVRLDDAREVRVGVDAADVEPTFQAFRIEAALVTGGGNGVTPLAPDGSPGGRRPLEEAPDFAVGRNDVVLFTGATWVEGEPDDGEGDGDGDVPALERPLPEAGVQFSGHPGQVSATAAAVCLTTDAIVIASPLGTGFLVRTGVQPYTLEVTDDAGEIARFLEQRGYDAG